MKLLIFLTVSWLSSTTSEVMPALQNMDLGDAYNLNEFEEGDGVFRSVANPVIIPENQNSIRFKVIDTKEDVKDLLNVNGALSLAIQAGATNVDVSASGGYLKEDLQNTKFVQVMAVMDIRTVTKTVSTRDAVLSGAGLNGKWTHYVRSISYGFRLIASLKATVRTESEKEDIKVQAKLDIKTAGFGIGVEGQFNQFKKIFSNNENTEIRVLTTLGSGSIRSMSIDSLLEKIKEFPSECKGNGVALFAELVPIDTLPQAQVQDIKMKDNHMKMILKRTSEEYNDLVVTQKAINEAGGEISDDVVRQKLMVLQSAVQPINTEYFNALSTIATQENAAAVETIQNARTMYVNGSKHGGIPGSFLRQFNIIMKLNKDAEIEGEVSTYLNIYRQTLEMVRSAEEKKVTATLAKNKMYGEAENIKDILNMDTLDGIVKKMKRDSKNVCNVAFANTWNKDGKRQTQYNHRAKFAKKMREQVVKRSGLYLFSMNGIRKHKPESVAESSRSSWIWGRPRNLMSALKPTCPSYKPQKEPLVTTLGVTVLVEGKKGQTWDDVLPSDDFFETTREFHDVSVVLLK